MKALAIKLKFDIKDVRKVLVLLDQDIPSDEEINKRFFDRDTIEYDINNGMEESIRLQLCASFVGFIMAIELDPELNSA